MERSTRDLDSEDQWQAWRIGRNCCAGGYTKRDALARLTRCFPQAEQRPFFEAGYAGLPCPATTAANPE